MGSGSARHPKGYEGGAPSPDGRKLRDLKGIPLTELQYHFNLWLLAGYQPAALRQGETVFIPKVEGTHDPGTTPPYHHVRHGCQMLSPYPSKTYGDLLAI